MHDRIKESDWKIFKELKPIALERYCNQVMRDVDKKIHEEAGDAHDRYLEMYKIVRDGDKKLAYMFDGFSRSKALDQLVMYYDNGLLNDEEMTQLSDETRERVHNILKMRRDF